MLTDYDGVIIEITLYFVEVEVSKVILLQYQYQHQSVPVHIQ